MTDGSTTNPVQKDQEAPLSFGPLTGYIGYNIRVLQAEIFRDLPDRMGDLDLTPGEFSLLALVGANPGISQVRLVAVYRLDKSTVSHAVAKMVRRGLIRTDRSRTDRRFHALSLTGEGATALDGATRAVEAQERQMESVLTADERQALMSMLKRISATFSGDD